MPMVWQEPAVAATSRDRVAYHLYKDNNPQTHWFTTAEWQDDAEGDYDEEPDYRFDVRNIHVPHRISKLHVTQQVQWIMEYTDVLRYPDDDPEGEGNVKWGYGHADL